MTNAQTYRFQITDRRSGASVRTATVRSKTEQAARKELHRQWSPARFTLRLEQVKS